MLKNNELITEEKNQTKGFTMIPNGLIFGGKQLTNTEFRLFCTLRYHAFQKDNCYPGRVSLAEKMGVSVATVDRAKKSLEQKGLISKKRRGQGLTNYYYLAEIYFPEADESPMSAQNESSVIRKENKVNKKSFKNYLVNQTSHNFSSTNEEPTSWKSPTKSKTPNEVIIISLLNRIKKNYENYPVEEFEKNEFSANLTEAIRGILYYLQRYKQICGESHPLYKQLQLKDCLFGLLNGMWEIEQRSLPLEQTIREIIEKWFETTNENPNNLHLSHFVGQASLIFYNCLNAL